MTLEEAARNYHLVMERLDRSTRELANAQESLRDAIRQRDELEDKAHAAKQDLLNAVRSP